MTDTSGVTEYEYDALYRLTGVTYPDKDTTDYTYDPMGNRLTQVIDGTTTLDYTYDDADQMTDVEGVSYDYDDNGNRTDADSDTFDWDAEDRLAGTDIDSVAGSYAYNGDGLRMSRTIDSVPVDYVWDQNAALPVILEDSDGNRYVYGLDLLTRINSTDEEWYLTDGLGSTTALADANGDVNGTYTYDVFGAERSHTGDATEFSYTGEQVDPSGLQYLRARYYDPGVGRFVSKDPLYLDNRYAYVSNTPTNLVDPSGLIGCGIFKKVCEVAAGTAGCVLGPTACAFDSFTGSWPDKQLVNIGGSAIAQLAARPSVWINKEGGFRLIERCSSTFCDALFTVAGHSVVTFGNTVLARNTCDFRCQAHEATHVAQYREHGLLGFLERYFGRETAKAFFQCLASGQGFSKDCIYENNNYEEDARRRASQD